jgi:hypothetical protein
MVRIKSRIPISMGKAWAWRPEGQSRATDSLNDTHLGSIGCALESSMPSPGLLINSPKNCVGRQAAALRSPLNVCLLEAGASLGGSRVLAHSFPAGQQKAGNKKGQLSQHQCLFQAGRKILQEGLRPCHHV